ncbi:hypothetical protein AABB24_012893, partial [Solanum stoloniferum]
MGSSSQKWVVGLLLVLSIFLELSAITFGDDKLKESRWGNDNGCGRFGRRGCGGRGGWGGVMIMVVDDLVGEVVVDVEDGVDAEAVVDGEGVVDVVEVQEEVLEA